MDAIRVMVVDDQADVRFLVGVLLGDHDDMRVVAEAATAGEALEGFAAAAPDAVIVDARMPIMDGYELAGRLLGERPELPIVLLTSIVDDHIREQAAAVGVHTVVSKADFD